MKIFRARNAQGQVVIAGTDAGNLLEHMMVHEEIFGERLYLDLYQTIAVCESQQ